MVISNPVSKSELKNLGVKAFKMKAERFAPQAARQTLEKCEFLTDNGSVYAALLHFNSGFLLLAADDAVTPVLAYDFNNNIDLDDVAPATLQLIEQYRNEILAVRRNKLAPDADATRLWNALRNGPLRDNDTDTIESTSVGPLLKSTWNQNKFYNFFSPYDEEAPAGYDNKTPNGCVAVAMSQIMYYYRYPKTGMGSHTNYSNYGNFYVNFAQQIYNYDAMCDKLKYFNTEVAKLIFHCGVSVDMMYGADGSGAYSHDVPGAMSAYFGYSNASQHVSKYEYYNSSWNNLLKQELDLLRPIYYSGYSEEGGHAFVCDGYQDDHFHFNFGWGGQGNGFFVTSSTSSDETVTGGYSGYQTAIIKLYPREDKYPEYCNDRLITAYNGTLEDGSGHSNYADNLYCTYIIANNAQFSVDVSLSSFETQQNRDFLRFWDKHPSNNNLLLELSGEMPSNVDYYFETDSLYITFETDDSISASGWRFSYQVSRDVIGCGNMQTYENSGTIVSNRDGEEYYKDNANCSWNIRPYNTEYLKFTFEQFEVSPEDHLDFYDLTTYPHTLLESFSGDNYPTSPIIINHGRVRVNFVSDNYLNDKGFKIHWESDNLEAIKDPAAELPVEVYPNPASDKLNLLVGDLYKVDVAIFDNVGKCLYHLVSQGNDHIQIPTNELSNGIYIVRLSSGNTTVHKKVVVKH